jgi:hypothetical protein
VYPVSYEADYQKDRNRLTTFFRLIVAIPWILVAIVYSIALTVVVIVAWFALIILGRYPQGMYDFVGGILRYSMRVTAFITLQTDEWPSFGISDDANYPVRIRFAPPAARQSRLKAFFRIILAIPLFLLTYLFSYLQQMVALIAWVTIVFRGYQPAGVHNALAFANSWYTRANSYIFLMRDEYPPVGDEVPVDVHPPAAVEAPAPAALGGPTPPLTSPGSAGAPGQSDPAAPSRPEAQDQPEAPAHPEAPAAPGAPDQAEPPSDPESPRS